MKKKMLKSVVLGMAVSGLMTVTSNADEMQIKNINELQEQFLKPPNESKPTVWYHWTYNATEERITKDLEAMAKQGLGGFTLFSSLWDNTQYNTPRAVQC